MTRKEFKQKLISTLSERGRETPEDQINSALNKLIRHMRNRDGGTSWEEDDVENAICFFNEFKVQNTFNREIRKAINQ